MVDVTEDGLSFVAGAQTPPPTTPTFGPGAPSNGLLGTDGAYLLGSDGAFLTD